MHILSDARWEWDWNDCLFGQFDRMLRILDSQVGGESGENRKCYRQTGQQSVAQDELLLVTVAQKLHNRTF